MQGEAKHHGEQQHLEDVSAGERANDAARNDVQQEGHHALILRLLGIDRNRFGIQRRGIDVHPRTWLHHVNDDQTNNQRKGTDHFKIEKRHCTGTANRLHAFHASDARDDRTEDHRRDDHFNELNERVAKRFHLRAQFRVIVTQQNTDGDGCQDLEIKTFEE